MGKMRGVNCENRPRKVLLSRCSDSRVTPSVSLKKVGSLASLKPLFLKKVLIEPSKRRFFLQGVVCRIVDVPIFLLPENIFTQNYIIFQLAAVETLVTLMSRRSTYFIPQP